MYAVVAEWNGTLAWFGAYPDKDTAYKAAEKVNGKVVIWNQK